MATVLGAAVLCSHAQRSYKPAPKSPETQRGLGTFCKTSPKAQLAERTRNTVSIVSDLASTRKSGTKSNNRHTNDDHGRHAYEYVLGTLALDIINSYSSMHPLTAFGVLPIEKDKQTNNVSPRVFDMGQFFPSNQTLASTS